MTFFPPSCISPTTVCIQAKSPHRRRLSSVLHQSLAHLKETHVRMVFVDFSSLSTIVPQNLVNKLVSLGIGTPMCNWLLDFLTDRPQFVSLGRKSLQHHLPEHWVSLKTHDCCARSTTNHHFDTTVVGLKRRGEPAGGLLNR